MATTIQRAVATPRGPDVPATIATPAYTAQRVVMQERSLWEASWQSLFYVKGSVGRGMRAQDVLMFQRAFDRQATATLLPAYLDIQNVPAVSAANSFTGARAPQTVFPGDGASVELVGDGGLEFFVSDDSSGMIVGLALGNVSSLFDFTHAFFFSDDNVVQAYARGEGMTFVANGHAGLFRMSRVSGVVSFYLDDVLVFTSATANTSCTRLEGLFVAYDEPIGSIAKLGGSAANTINGIGDSYGATLPARGASFDVAEFGHSASAVAAPISVADDGTLTFAKARADATGPASVGVSFGIADGVGTSISYTNPAAGVSSDTPAYAAAVASYNIDALGASHDAELSVTAWFEPVLMWDEMDMLAELVATFTSSVDISDTVFLTIELIEGMEWFDALLASSTTDMLADRTADWGETLAVSDQLGSDQRAGIQYATNINTGAITSYDGFDFLSFVTLPSGTYGLRSDGLYKIEGGSDNGAPRDAHVDWGANAFGSVYNKHLDSVFFGLTTDGTPMAVLAGDDGVKRAYTVAKRAEFMRADFGKGRLAKRWSLRLEVHDATQAELDGVELVVHESSRRWIK